MKPYPILTVAFLFLVTTVSCSPGTSEILPDTTTGEDVATDTGDDVTTEDIAINPDLVIPEDLTPDACLPECDEKECGDDGCGGNCGDCGVEGLCNDGTCVAIGTPCQSLDDCYPLICDVDEGICTQCTLDEQCEPAGEYCSLESSQCVECLEDAHCDEGFGCKEQICAELTCPELDCPDNLVCDEVVHACVECLDTSDCPEFHECIEQLCLGPTPCESSKDCALNEVCDKINGYCFECVEDVDCLEGHRCNELHVCEEILFCQSDKECKDYDKVCDKIIGECVDCLSDLDCAEPFYCQNNTCLPDVCDQTIAWPACVDQAIVECNENGSVFTVVLECPEGTFCFEAECKDLLCEPDSAGCLGSIAFLCNDDGSGFDEETDCAEDNMACSAGECKEVICEPGETVCLDELTLVTCLEDGTDFLSQPCGDSLYCDTETNICVAWICQPDSQVCDDNTSKTCNPFGSGWAEEIDCGENDLYCVAGACTECDPQCGNKECGPDACGGTCGGCGMEEECMAGYCLFVQCGETCEGITAEAFQCGIDICYPGLMGEAVVETPNGDNLQQMFNVAASYGEGNDLVPFAGTSLAVMASGKLYNSNHEDAMPPNQCINDPHADGEACDSVRTQMELTAPPGAMGFHIDYVFLSAEFPVSQKFNDAFYMHLTAPVTTNGEKWIINFMECNNPEEYTSFTYDETSFCYINVFSEFEENPVTTNVSGTGFTGSTGWLRTQWPVAPEETFTIETLIFDFNDGNYDSAVVMDNFNWIWEPTVPMTTYLQ
jgi:hypothetical protein